MFKSLLDGLCAAAGAAIFSVLPSFIQQYLSGLSAVQGYVLRQNPVAATPSDEAYRQFLATAIQQIDSSSGFGRLFAFIRNFNLDIARDTLRTFEPGVQFTLDGLYFFAVGIIVGLIVSNLLALILSWPFRRRHRRSW